jgi:hypothetical protein
VNGKADQNRFTGEYLLRNRYFRRQTCSGKPHVVKVSSVALSLEGGISILNFPHVIYRPDIQFLDGQQSRHPRKHRRPISRPSMSESICFASRRLVQCAVQMGIKRIFARFVPRFWRSGAICEVVAGIPITKRKVPTHLIASKRGLNYCASRPARDDLPETAGFQCAVVRAVDAGACLRP